MVNILSLKDLEIIADNSIVLKKELEKNGFELFKEIEVNKKFSVFDRSYRVYTYISNNEKKINTLIIENYLIDDEDCNCGYVVYLIKNYYNNNFDDYEYILNYMINENELSNTKKELSEILQKDLIEYKNYVEQCCYIHIFKNYTGKKIKSIHEFVEELRLEFKKYCIYDLTYKYMCENENEKILFIDAKNIYNSNLSLSLSITQDDFLNLNEFNIDVKEKIYYEKKTINYNVFKRN